ncbi:ABC transporter B family member 4-like isoform X2 [Phragmites australis]|uniref:ABC transporter B family member 4-like isoform X2 n=1 Tax=Phragmites australis TaxID=29695 RepID=UPI002D7786D7|nr:ABC transporter B family member 4-like isoform X2 [Phragmites australis]
MASGQERSGADDVEGGAGEEGAEKPAAVVERVPLHRLFAFADRMDAALMAVGAAAAVANGMAQPLMTFIFGDVIDAFGSTASSGVLHRVIKVIMNFVYLAIGAGLASTLQVSCWTITGERQGARIRALYLKAILRQDIAFFDMELSTGQVVERMTGDTFLIQDAIGEKVGKSIQLLSTFVGGFIIAFVRGWLLALVMLSCIPPIAVAGAIVSRLMTRLSTRMQSKYGEAGNIVEQTLGAIRTVVSFSGEKQAIMTYNTFIRKACESALQEGAVSGLGLGSVMAVLFCSYGLAVWYGSRLIVKRGYNGGMVISVIMAVMIGAMSLGQATPSVTAFAEGQGAAYRMFKTIERQPDIDIHDATGIILEDIKGDVELKDVYFSYPTRPEHLVFDGFSLRVPSGTTMALVGESGSGKSTVISLMERFYDPHAGEVLIDGVDIKRMNLGWIRGKIGLVSQEPVLFSTTIRENIAYGKEDLTLEKIKEAVELANASKFIDKLPNGLETMVGERGTQLSGGQKQRIAIARAIVKNPRILLLDEATSALDMESERVVQEALNRVMLQRTTIIVAHRLSTVKNADVISVLQHGKMVEQGSHAELMKIPEGAYSQLIHLQQTHQETQYSTVDPDMIVTNSFGSRSINTKPRSQSISRRSTSEGSSFEHSGRHSLPAPLGLPDPMEFSEALDIKEETTDEVTSARKKAPIGRLFRLNKPEAFVLALGSITAAMHGLIFPIYGILISTAIEVFYEPPEVLLKDSRFWASMFVVLGACALVLIPIEYFLFGLAGGKLVERIRSMTFQSVMRQEINWFDKPEHSSGSIGARLSTDALNVKRLVGDNLALNVQTISTVISGFTIAMVANWKLAMIITVVVPLVGFQGYAQIKFLKGLNKNAKLKYEEASQVATDAVGGIRTVSSFCAEKKVMETYEKMCESPIRQGIREGVISGLGFGFSFLAFYFTYALCFYVGAKFVQQGTATFPEVFRVFFVLVLATSGISRTSAVGVDSNKANDAAVSIFEILDRKSKIDYSSQEGVTIASVRGDIDFQNVCFKYPLRPNVQIFKHLSLSIPSGKTVALVGESGSGKSTVIALLERFYDSDSGTYIHGESESIFVDDDEEDEEEILILMAQSVEDYLVPSTTLAIVGHPQITTSSVHFEGEEEIAFRVNAPLHIQRSHHLIG